METAQPPSLRKAHPRPLLFLIVVVAFAGGSCTLQRIATTSVVPTEEELAKTFEQRGGLAERHPEASQKIVSAFHVLMTEQARIMIRFRPYQVGFGILLVAAYSFLFLAALRAFNHAPGAARLLSIACVWVLPARVACGAVDFASARQLEPALKAFTSIYSQAWGDLTPADADRLGAAAGWLAASLEGALTVTVCTLFFVAWRYFQRPEVIAFFERKAAGRTNQ